MAITDNTLKLADGTLITVEGTACSRDAVLTLNQIDQALDIAYLAASLCDSMPENPTKKDLERAFEELKEEIETSVFY